MIGIGLHIGNRVMGGGGGFDVDAQAFFDRVTAAGGTLTTTEKNATNQLVLDMKSAGIWSAMKAVYPMVGASAAACAQNLVSASFTGTFTSGWTFASTGVTPNGTSAYMNTGLNTSIDLTFDDFHMSYYSRTNNSTTGYEIGIADNFVNIIFNYGGGGTGYISYRGYDTFAVTNSTGFQVASLKTTTFKGYKNGVTKISKIASTTSFPNRNVFVGSDNRGVAIEFSTKQCAFSSIGDGLTDTQASNFYTAVQAFQTTLSRQV
jgi:hypothetical protein